MVPARRLFSTLLRRERRAPAARPGLEERGIDAAEACEAPGGSEHGATFGR